VCVDFPLRVLFSTTTTVTTTATTTNDVVKMIGLARASLHHLNLSSHATTTTTTSTLAFNHKLVFVMNVQIIVAVYKVNFKRHIS